MKRLHFFNIKKYPTLLDAVLKNDFSSVPVPKDLDVDLVSKIVSTVSSLSNNSSISFEVCDIKNIK